MISITPIYNTLIPLSSLCPQCYDSIKHLRLNKRNELVATIIPKLTFLHGFLDRRVFDERKDGLGRDDFNRKGVRLHEIDSRLVDLGHRWFRAREGTGGGQTVGTIAPRSNLFVISGLRYAQAFRRADSAVDAGRRCSWTLTIGAILRRRDDRADVPSPSR